MFRDESRGPSIERSTVLQQSTSGFVNEKPQILMYFEDVRKVLKIREVCSRLTFNY